MEEKTKAWGTLARWAGRQLYEFALPIAIGAALLTIHYYMGAVVSRSSDYTLSGEELEKIGIRSGPVTLLSDDTARFLWEQARRDAGIKKITHVRRVFPKQVEIHVQTRTAWIAVKSGTRYVVLDDEGVRLSEADQRPSTRTGLVLSGVRHEDDRLAGFEMAKRIAASPLLQSLVSEIDLGNFRGRASAGEPEIVLVSRSGCRIHWGSAAVESDGFEPSLEEKLANLAIIARHYPSLDGLEYAKIYIRNRPTVRRSRPAGVTNQS
jgi:hypothetical protein